jgi:hypothetical protein
MTTPFDSRPSGTAIARRSWASLYRAVPAMAPLFLAAIALSEILTLLTFGEPHVARVLLPRNGSPLTQANLASYTVTTIATTIAWAAIAAPVAVAMHRFILLDRTTKGTLSWRPSYTRSFFVWLVISRLLFTLATIPKMATASMGREILIQLPTSALLLFIYVHLAMIFPSVATEVPATNWRARIAGSWNDMRGNFWLMVRAGIVTFLPIFIAFIALEIAALIFIGLPTASATANPMPLGLVLTLGLFQSLGIALGAAVASWTYAWIRQSHPEFSHQV